MEKSLLMESQNELKKQQEGMIELRKEIEELKKEREEGQKNEKLQNQRRPIEKSVFKNAGIPPPPEGVYPPVPPPPPVPSAPPEPATPGQALPTAHSLTPPTPATTLLAAKVTPVSEVGLVVL